MKVFIAGPMFSSAEREFNLKVDDFLRERGFETFLPQREVGELWEKVHGRGRRVCRKIYEEDLRGLGEADSLVAILNGQDVDSGTAFEVGYASATGKPIVGLKTDVRVFARGEEVNLMLAHSLHDLAKDLDELVLKLKKLSPKNLPGTTLPSPRR